MEVYWEPVYYYYFSSFVLDGSEGVQLFTDEKRGPKLMYFEQYKDIITMFIYCTKYKYVGILGGKPGPELMYFAQYKIS